MNGPSRLPLSARPDDPAALRSGDAPPHDGPVHGRGDDPVGIEVFAMKWFVASEAMMFAVLVAVYLNTALSQGDWPPADQPRLPVLTTLANTLVLFASGWAMLWAERALERGEPAAGARRLRWTSGLGTLFLTVQGVEWARMLGHGLTVTSSLYGWLFYIVIGAHGLHVAIAVGFLAWVALRSRRGRYGPGRMTGVRLCRIFWLFVVAVWPCLFVTVYLL